MEQICQSHYLVGKIDIFGTNRPISIRDTKTGFEMVSLGPKFPF